MARPIWSGAVSFGLVSVPVALHGTPRDHTVHFHQLQRGTSDRVRNKRVNERTGKEVAYEDVVKGREVSDGKYVVLEQEELDAVAPGRSRSLEISTFVDLDEIDPIFFSKTYWLGPAQDKDAKPYALLLKAMEKTNRAGIGNFVMRGKEYLAAIRADNGVLALETLYFADEILDSAEQVGDLPDLRKAQGKEVDMAVSLVDSMTGPWSPEEYRDTYTERVEQLVKDKQAGREVESEPEAGESEEVVDLLEALRQSVEKSKGSRGGRKQTAKKQGAKKQGAKKQTAKKQTAKKQGAKKQGAKKQASTRKKSA
jgi:DNA end-binding protein Ku